MPYYTTAGLIINSTLPLPELLTIKPDSAGDIVDITIEESSIPEHLSHTTFSCSWFETSKTSFLLKIPNVAKYLIRNGNQIQVDIHANVEQRNMRLYLLGSAMGALYFQRGDFPLHASVIAGDRHAIAFTGDSGAGKSTLAAWMYQQGYPLLCDDVCVIRFHDDGIPYAYPGFPRIKLWDDALRAMHLDKEMLPQDFTRTEKYHMPVLEKFHLQPMPLKHINILRFSEQQKPESASTMSPAQAAPFIRNNTYRREYIPAMGITKQHYLQCIEIIRNVCIHDFVREKNHNTMDHNQMIIEQQLQ